jgi:hypothetical protein
MDPTTANVVILPLESPQVTPIPKGIDVTMRAEITRSDPRTKFENGNYILFINAPKVECKDLCILDEEVTTSDFDRKQTLSFTLSSEVLQETLGFKAILGTQDLVASTRYPVTLNLSKINADGEPKLLGSGLTYLAIAPEGAGEIRRSITSKEITATEWTDDVVLFHLIKKSTSDLSFRNYAAYMDFLLCNADNEINDACMKELFIHPKPPNPQRPLTNRRFLPFNDTDAYRLLKVATETFVIVKSGVDPATFRHCVCPEKDPFVTDTELGNIAKSINALVNFPPAEGPTAHYQKKYIRDLDQPFNADNTTGNKDVLPYIYLIAQKLRDLPLKEQIFPVMSDLFGNGKAHEDVDKCIGLIRHKLQCPIMIELIWSYWHEQGMHAQTMYAIRDRFQNRRSGPAPDPLAAMEIGVLRPLNNILWGYIQDEQHRLTITRRCYEYDHLYGISLQGKAVPQIQAVDSRSKFLEAFHNLLYLCTVFFKEDDDTNRKADAFPVLNAIKEVHFLLSEGAHNQFGDLPTTARIEMLMEQWLLARTEMREFLPSRDSIAYPEDWMGTVDSMKTIQGWSNTSSLYFHDLGVFGEQILLSLRYNQWSQINDRNSAANWARLWRSEIQGYMHAYRTATGVDLTVEPTEPRLQERKLDPAVLLSRRMEEQRRLGAATRGGQRLPPSPSAGIRLPALRQPERT